MRAAAAVAQATSAAAALQHSAAQLLQAATTAAGTSAHASCILSLTAALQHVAGAVQLQAFRQARTRAALRPRQRHHEQPPPEGLLDDGHAAAGEQSSPSAAAAAAPPPQPHQQHQQQQRQSGSHQPELAAAQAARNAELHQQYLRQLPWRQQWQYQQQQQALAQHMMMQSAQATQPERRQQAPPEPSDARQHASKHQQQQQGRDPRSSSSSSSRSAGGRGGAHVDPMRLTTAITAANSLPGLQQLLQQYQEHVQQIHVCAAFKAVVRLSAPGTAGSRAVVADTSSSERGAPPAPAPPAAAAPPPPDRSVALELMRQLGSRMRQQIRVARPWDLAQAAWACSKLDFRDSPLLDAIAQQAQRKAAVLLPQDIAQLASAYARLGYTHPQLLQLLLHQAVAKAADFRPWSLVHTAWALQRCGLDVQALASVVVQQLAGQPGQLAGLKALDMSTLLWLMAGHDLHDASLLEEAEQLLTERIDSYPPAALSQLVLCCARLGLSTPALTSAAAGAVLQTLQHRRFSPRQAGAAAFGLAKLQACSADVMAAAAGDFARQPRAYGPNALSMLCWAAALSGQAAALPAEFWALLLQRSREQLPAFTADQLASLLRGVVTQPGWRADDAALALLADAPAVLQGKLHDISTPVLRQLVRSLARQCTAGQQQYVAAAPDTSSTDAGSSTGPEGQQQVMELLLACMGELVQPRHTQRTTQQEAHVLAAALAGCKEAQLQAAAEQLVEAADARKHAAGAAPPAAAAAPTTLQQPATNAAGRPSMQPSGSSWVDSFVAAAD